MASIADATPVGRPPVFFSGLPGGVQFATTVMQRHQARILLYREALEELSKNPQAADVPECPPIETKSIYLCIRRPAIPTTAGTTTAIRRRIAVLVGNNGYKKPIPVLDTPIADVDKIAEVLRTRFGYETQVLHDAGKAQIIQTINKIAEEAKPEDSVLVYYAGHGFLMDETKMGFWIPIDGSANTAANWISNTDISRLLHAIPSRQIILVSDSCFSGLLTREQRLTDTFYADPKKILQRRAVLVLSSGGEGPVFDTGRNNHSIFAWNLIKTLGSVQGHTIGFEVYRAVQKGVVKDFPQQVPQYGAVISAGHMNGGEYLFDTMR